MAWGVSLVAGEGYIAIQFVSPATRDAAPVRWKFSLIACMISLTRRFPFSYSQKVRKYRSKRRFYA